MCTVTGSFSANYSAERCHTFHIVWAPKVGSLPPLHFYQFMISVKYCFFFSFIIINFINHWSHKWGPGYFTCTCSRGLANLRVANYYPNKVFFYQRIELESLFSSSDIINQVAKRLIPQFRPEYPTDITGNKGIIRLMQMCWDNDPLMRPTFSEIKSKLKSLNRGK